MTRLLATPALLLICGFGALAALATETPDYERIGEMAAGDRYTVEIRRYAPFVEAWTETEQGSDNSAFRTLAGYIFGGNETGESIDMTAPVVTRRSGDAMRMSFIMPRQHSLESLPEPEDRRVKLQARDERVLAVLQFSGLATRGKVERMRLLLEKTLAEHGLQRVGEMELGRYDPPWTLPPWRTNQVAYELRPFHQSETTARRSREYTL